MASFWDALLSDTPQAAGLSGGLLGLGAALSDAGRPRLVMREGYGPGLLGAVGNAGAALGVGMQQGRQGYLANKLRDQAAQRDSAMEEAFSGAPDEQLSPMGRQYRAAAARLPENVRAALPLVSPEDRGGLLGRALAAQGGSGLMNVGPGGTVFDPTARQVVYQAPFAPRQPMVVGDRDGGYYALDPNQFMPQAGGRAPMPAPAAPRGAAPMAAPASAPAELMPHIEAASQETGVPVPWLVAQMKQESSFNPNATGRAGEIGLMQIKPTTAQSPGFGLAPVDPASLRDPAANIMFGARYLAARGKAAGVRDWNDPAQVATALSAYNGGGDPNYVQNVTRYLPRGGMQGGSDVTLAQSSPQQGAPAQAPRGLTPLIPPRPSERWEPIPTPEGETGQWERNSRTMERRRIGGGSGVTVNTTVSADKSLATGLAENATKGVEAARTNAFRAVEGVQSSQRVLSLLDSGAITGTGADFRTMFARAAATAGLIDGERVSNTEQLASELAKGTLSAAEGLKGPTSDRDILFLREVAAGRIELTEQTLRRVAKLNEQMARRAVTEYNDLVRPLGEDRNQPEMVRHYYRPLEIPSLPQEQRQGPTPDAAPAPNPAPVRVRTPSEAWNLPPGTPIILPDGSTGRVPPRPQTTGR